eukprot:g4034.t1
MSIRNHRVAHNGDINHEQGRRKSSAVQSFRDLFIGNQSQGNDRSGPKPENSKLMDKIEQKLQRFRNEFKQLQKQEALNLAEIYFNEEDFQGDEIRRKEMVEICKVFARDVVREHFEQVEKAKQAIMRQRCTITAAIEVLDEGTDLALTIQYFSGAVSTIWAGWVMLAFMVANRGLQFIWSIIHHESWKRSAEAILGVRAITDTYYMITAGPNAKVGGSKASMQMVQALRIMVSLALESLPQVTSVMASCGAMGMSAATSAFDIAHANKVKGIHLSISGWVPPDDEPARQTIVYVSMVVYYSLHMLLFGFGASCLFSLAPWYISLGVLGGHFTLYTLVRLLINKGDLRIYLRSAENWKDILRDELWDLRWHSSEDWHISSLNGDLDASRASWINRYPRDHLPWERIKTWLTEKTEDFLNHPPLWLSHKWLNLIPAEIRNDVWNVEQYNILKDAITQADENDDTGEREKVANEIF